MYYNEIRQPDGTPIIGINYEEERPHVVDVLTSNETQQVQQQEPEYELFNSLMIAWLNVFLVALSVHYTILYDNILTIINCLACVLPLHSIQNNSIHGIFLYTIYVMIAMLLTTSLGFYEYIWYYVICNGIITCIFITSVVKYIKYIRNQNQNRNINEQHVV
jgi:hypothetical protein|tara:strand:- start:1652 stop:2137 length:486 start_codon:yes stop_codon:yes gene_type:complete